MTIEEMRYLIRDRESGNVISKFATLKDARMALELYEEQDKVDGIYKEDFYEIYVLLNDEAV